MTREPGPASRLTADERRGLDRVADLLIPGDALMPAASSVGVAGEQVDAVLASRPDLLTPLRAALRHPVWEGADAPGASMSALRDDDPEAHDALATTVLAAYYLSAEVKARLGYPGQQPLPLTVGFPEYVTEGLLDHVVERGARYRVPPAEAR